MEFLNDMYEETGDTIESFKAALRKMEEQTSIRKVNMDDIYFLSVSDQGTGYAAVPLHSDESWKKTKCSMSLKKYGLDKDVYMKKGYGQDVTDQAFSNGLFLAAPGKKIAAARIKGMVASGDYIPVSEKAMSTVSSRTDCVGDGFFSERLVRDLVISKRFNKPVPVSLVIRTDPETKLGKVFAVMSDKYKGIPQSVIGWIIDDVISGAEPELGEATCAGWMVNHNLTRIYMEFPKAGDEFKETYGLPDRMVPGILLETSDIGDSALKVRGYFRMGASNTISFMEEKYCQMHAGDNVDARAVAEGAKSEIFPKYTKYPERLAELMAIDLTDDTMKPAEKIKTMSTLYRKVSRSIGLVKAITKSREKVLMAQMIDAINPEINYTAYDVAMEFLTLASRIDSKNRKLIDLIAKTAPNVMKYDFKPEEPEEDILLIA